MPVKCTCFLSAVLLLLAAMAFPAGASAPQQDRPWTDNRLAAHAMGAVNSRCNTNTYEAFLIPQFYNEDIYREVDAVYPFPSYIYTLYQTRDSDGQVLDFVRRHERIDAVAMSPQREQPPFVAALNNAGTPVYVHTVNHLQDMESMLSMRRTHPQFAARHGGHIGQGRACCGFVSS